MFLASKVTFSWPSVDRFGIIFWGLMTLVKLKVYQISADLVNRELRNATFEGKQGSDLKDLRRKFREGGFFGSMA